MLVCSYCIELGVIAKMCVRCGICIVLGRQADESYVSYRTVSHHHTVQRLRTSRSNECTSHESVSCIPQGGHLIPSTCPLNLYKSPQAHTERVSKRATKNALDVLNPPSIRPFIHSTHSTMQYSKQNAIPCNTALEIPSLKIHPCHHHRNPQAGNTPPLTLSSFKH